VTWAEILDEWELVEADLHQVYGIDMEDRALLRARSWRWLRVRIAALLSMDSRIYRQLARGPEDVIGSG
jgi:hypothetical protein